MIENFGNEVVKGNKGRDLDHSDNEPNLRSMNMIFTRPEHLGVLDFDNEVMDYLAYSLEISKSGYKHYQGFVCWKCSRWTYACKKKYGHYFAYMKGKLIQNDDYCSKQGTLTEFGRLPKQGERTDLKNIVTDIFEHKINVDQIIQHNPMLYHQYGRTLEKAQNLAYKERTKKPIVHWYYGESGVGKTKKATLINADYWFYNTETKWWDGYKQQHTIIIDDIRQDTFKLNTLLRILDHYKYAGEVKGGFININSPYIVITSDEGPHHWWQGNDLKQIKRRIDLLVYFDANGKEHIMT